MNLETLGADVSPVFQRQSVVFAYLFGSQAAGGSHPESNVDIAVLLSEALTADERFAVRLTLIGELSRICLTDNVDLAVLNEASPLLA